MLIIISIFTSPFHSAILCIIKEQWEVLLGKGCVITELLLFMNFSNILSIYFQQEITNNIFKKTGKYTHIMIIILRICHR